VALVAATYQFSEMLCRGDSSPCLGRQLTKIRSYGRLRNSLGIRVVLGWQATSFYIESGGRGG
jgi:hypothetical protein